MVRRTLVGAVLVASSLALWSDGPADAKGICLERALEQGYAVRNANGAILYRPHLPTAADYEACGITLPANAIIATPELAG